jgi:hypothetical protein
MSSTVERRKHYRLIPTESTHVVVLGEGGTTLEGLVLDISARGIGLRVPQALPVGTALKVEGDNDLLLGEVTSCERDAHGYRIGMEIKHRLAGLAELHRLNRALNQSPPLATAPPVPAIMVG